MALTFVFGNSGSGKSEYIFRKAKQLAEKDFYQNFYIIVPEQFTMAAQKALVERSSRQIIMNIDVVSFERLAYRIFDELGVHQTVMEETGKSLVLRRIAEEKATELTVLKGNVKKMGYIAQLKSMISELMQYDVSVTDLEAFLQREETKGNLYYKLSDIHVIYKAFEAYLQERYVTAERVLEVLLEHAEESEKLRNSVLFLDGFTGFTPVQMKLLHRLMHVVKDIYVTVTMDVREDAYAEKGIQELFYMSRKMTRSLLHAAKEEGFSLADPVYLDPKQHSRMLASPVLFHLEQNLFRAQGKRYGEDCADALRIYSLTSPKEELVFAASKICQMMRSEDYRYADFAIVSGDVERYGKYAESVFGLYDMPFFVDKKRTVMYHPFIELIRAVLEMAEKNYTYESVFRYLRTGLTGFTTAEIDVLENYVLAKGIRGAKKWQKKFLKPARPHSRVRISEEEIQKEFALLNQLRERFWKQTKQIYEAFRDKEASVREQTIQLYNFITSLQIEEQLQEKEKKLSARGEETLASEYRQIYKIVIDLLDKMVDLLGEQKMSVQDYTDVLEAGFSSATVGVVPPGSDCVILGDIERTRLDGIKVLFFLGVNDGVIPKNTGHGGILSQYDRERLEREQLTLSPTAREQSFLQRFYLYLNMTKPSDALYLTYARINADGKAVRPSYLIGTLTKLFPELMVEELDGKTMFSPVTAKSSLNTYLNGLMLARKGDISPEWKALHRWFSEQESWAPVLEKFFQAAFGGYSGEYLEADIAKLLYGSVLTNSVTRLEQFAKCAYAHFLSYGLKLSERELYQFADVDMGSMFHEILQRYCERLEKSYDWYSITEQAQDTLLQEAMEETVLAMPNEILLDSARNAYVLERVFRIMKRSIWALTEQIRRGSFKPIGYEVDFTQVNQLQISDMTMPQERKMQIIGRIDRLDTYETEDKIYVRVIDYKSGKTTFQLLNLYYGRQLQLVVYLNAAMEKLKKEHPTKEIVPAGIFYYRLDDPMIDDKQQSEEEIMEDILGQLRFNGLVSLDPEVYNHMDSKIKEKSSIIPLTLRKDGSIASSGTFGAGRKEFSALTSFVNQRIGQAAEQIFKGDIQVNPFALSDRTGCDYCPYKSICGFDRKIPGYAYQRQETYKEDRIWNRIIRETAEKSEKENREE